LLFERVVSYVKPISLIFVKQAAADSEYHRLSFIPVRLTKSRFDKLAGNIGRVDSVEYSKTKTEN